MKKVMFLLALLMLTIGIGAAAAATPVAVVSPRIAVIPYINTTEEEAEYIPEIIDAKYANYFSGRQKLAAVPALEVQKALNETGFDVSNMELPEREMIAAVAQATKADYVVAMEVSQLTTTRHMAFFQAKVVTKAKLRYKFYHAAKGTLTPFQVTGEAENKTVLGDVGFKDPITRALNEAMDKANEKIMGLL